MSGITSHFFFLITLMVLISACGAPIDYPPGCTGPELLLDLSVFPDGTVMGPIITPYPEGTVYSAGTQVGVPDSWSITYAIMPYSSARSAQRQFEDNLRAPIFSPRTPASNWTTPPALASALGGADARRIGCGINRSSYRCEGIARYGNYFLRIIATPGPPAFAETELAAILTVLEEDVTGCVARIGE